MVENGSRLKRKGEEMAVNLTKAKEAQLVKDLVWKLHFSAHMDRKSSEWASQYGWYNGYVSALYTIYGDKVAERIQEEAQRVFDAQQKEG
jgi:hypothetical protein